MDRIEMVRKAEAHYARVHAAPLGHPNGDDQSDPNKKAQVGDCMCAHYACTCMYCVCMCACIRVYTYIHLHALIHLHTQVKASGLLEDHDIHMQHTHTHIIHTYMHTCRSKHQACGWIATYICIHTYTHTHNTHIHAHMQVKASGLRVDAGGPRNTYAYIHTHIIHTYMHTCRSKPQVCVWTREGRACLVMLQRSRKRPCICQGPSRLCVGR